MDKENNDIQPIHNERTSVLQNQRIQEEVKNFIANELGH